MTSSADEYTEKAEKPSNLLGQQSQTAYVGQVSQRENHHRTEGGC